MPRRRPRTRFLARRRRAVSSIVGSVFFVLIMLLAIASLVTIFNAFTSYNDQVNQVSDSNLQAAETQLSVTSGQFGAFPPSTTSNYNVATGCLTTSTSPTNRENVFYAASMWWEFYTCNGAYQYSDSFDGVTWSGETSIPSVITTGYTVGPDFDVEVMGTTIYLAIARVGAANFQLGIGTLVEGGSDSAPDGVITWTYAPTNVATTANAFGPINMAIDNSGNQFVAVVQGTCTTTTNCAIAVYEHEACATAANQGWEPNACGSATNPTNYAPTALGTLSANTHTIFFPAISSYSATGAILVYETGSATAASTGTLGVVTQTALATATWNTITLTGITDYSLTSSSATLVGSTLYVAGLANAAVGQTTGTLDFWTLAFSSMTAATNTAQTVLQATARAWMGAITSSDTTLALFFSYPTSTTVQYYISSTLGSIWSSALTLESAETAVNGLSPASGAFAVTWANSAPNVRFAALSSFLLTNNSPFSTHVVDAYVYNPSTDALVAHWYYNTTEDFDYWVGQGGTMEIPLQFVWTASTSYLITFSTDTGVTAQTTLTSLPGNVVSCPTGEYYAELSPLEECMSTASTNPILQQGSSVGSCADAATAAEFMGMDMQYTTSPISSGNLFLSFTFQIASPATTSISSAWQLFYGAGTPPTCEAASSYTGTATAVGEVYTVRTQAANIRQLSQSLSVAISGLAPSTTYWFDVEGTNSAGTWTYSNPHVAVAEVQSTNSPTISTSEDTNACSISSATAGMGGLGTTFTTPSSGYSGTTFGELTFNIADSTAATGNTQYTIHYGTGTAPTCHAAATGTATGDTYEFISESGTAGHYAGSGQKIGFVITGLTAGATYWVDVAETDSAATPTWVYSNPTLAVMSLPTAGTDSIPAAISVSNTNTCSDTTAGTAFPGYAQMGFGLYYNVPTSATGNLLVSLTFEIAIPTTTNVGSTWQASYGSGLAPTCHTEETGLSIGQSFEVTSPSGTAGGREETETIVLSDVQKIAGTDLWFDLQVYDTSGATWTYSNPAISVVMFPQ